MPANSDFQGPCVAPHRARPVSRRSGDVRKSVENTVSLCPNSGRHIMRMRRFARRASRGVRRSLGTAYERYSAAGGKSRKSAFGRVENGAPDATRMWGRTTARRHSGPSRPLKATRRSLCDAPRMSERRESKTRYRQVWGRPGSEHRILQIPWVSCHRATSYRLPGMGLCVVGHGSRLQDSDERSPAWQIRWRDLPRTHATTTDSSAQYLSAWRSRHWHPSRCSCEYRARTNLSDGF